MAKQKKTNKQNFNPLVSIIIPVYNGEKYLGDAINSALSQTYKNIEIIVVNDGSQDNTEEVALSYGNKIQYYSKENGGVASALNFALNYVKGYYISWLSHDDVYNLKKIELEVKALEKSSADLVICNVDLVNSNLELIEHHYLKKDFSNNPLAFLALDVLTGINGCALLIKKTVFDEVGLFDTNLKTTQDYDMWWRILKKYKIIQIQDSLVLSRQHDEQGSKTIETVSNEVDNLHYSFITKLSNDEFKRYFLTCNETIEELFILFLSNMNSPLSAYSLLLKDYDCFKNGFLLEKYLMNYISNFKIINNKKKAILYYYDKWITGGIERVLSIQMKELSKKYNVFLLTLDYNKEESFQFNENVIIIDIKGKVKDNIDKIILFFCKMLNIKIYIGSQNIESKAYEIYRLLNINNIKTVAYNHYNYFLPYEVKWLSNIIEIRRTYAKYIDASVWINKNSAEIYSIDNNNSYYIPNASNFSLSDIKTTFGKRILCIGRFDDLLKRLDLSLKVFAIVLKKIPEAKLTIVGKVDYETPNIFINNLSIMDYIKVLNIPTDSVNFVGRSTNVEKYYEKNDLILLTSESEGFGMVILEGANYGIPTISFEIPGINDLIHDNENGFLIKYPDTDKMATTIIDYLNDSEKQFIMKNASKELIKSFNVKRMINDWNILIESLLSDNFKSNVDKDNISKKEICDSYELIINKINQKENFTNDKKNTYLSKINNKIIYYYKKNGFFKTVTWLIFYPIIKMYRRVKIDQNFGSK